MINFEIKRIIPEMNLVEEIKIIEKEAFLSGAIDEWVIMPLMRHGRIYGAFIDQKLIGIIEMIISDSMRGYIFSFAISKNFQSKGIGKRFLEKLIKHFVNESQLIELCLTSAHDNVRANKIYQKLGFEAVNNLKNEYGQGIDRLYFVKKL